MPGNLLDLSEPPEFGLEEWLKIPDGNVTVAYRRAATWRQRGVLCDAVTLLRLCAGAACARIA
jgi:hypothetical protein